MNGEVSQVTKGNWSNDRGPVSKEQIGTKDQQLSAKEQAIILNMVDDKNRSQLLFRHMAFVLSGRTYH